MPTKKTTPRNTVNVTLKDGTTIKLHGYESFMVKGEVAFSHFLTPLSPAMIKNKNELRDEWAKNGSGPYYKDDVNVPYSEITLKNVSILPKHEQFLTYGEQFAMNRFYESVKFPGVPKINLKNHIASVSTAKLIGEEIVPSEFEDELAPDTEVLCKGMIYFTKQGNPAIALTEVISVGEPVYLDRSKYQKKLVAA